MAKSFVLKALRIFGLEDMLYLSRTGAAKAKVLKKAAGDDLIVWGEALEVENQASVREEKNATILPFRAHGSDDFPSFDTDFNQSCPSAEVSSGVDSTEYILWNREMKKDTNSPVLKRDAVKEYSRSNEMYVVKTLTDEGADKIRFASISGVLVNKKQA